MTILRRLLRAAAAAIAVAAILVGAPIALWSLGRPLLPDTVPGWTQIVDALSRPDDGRLLLGALVLVGAGAWLILALSILVEIVAVVTRRPVVRIELPGFRLGRTVAAALVAALLGLGSAPALALPAATTTSWIAPPLPTAQATTPMLAPVGKVHVVVARDTLWGIAERELGDPLRWREIYDLNAGTPQQVGGTLTEPSMLTIGWHLQLPAAAPHGTQVAVKAGDTLSAIAEERLGTAAKTAALFEENRGKPQTNGAALVNPDEIRPGWILTLPHPDARPPQPQPPVVAAPPAPATDQPTRPATPTPPTPTRATPPPASTTQTPGPSATAAPQPSINNQTAPTAPTAAQPTIGEASPTAAAPAVAVAVPVTLAASTLIVGATLGALAVRRRRQRRARPAYHRVAVPPDDAGRVEWLGTHAVPPKIDIGFLDTALRSLGLANWQGITTPPLRAARLSPGRAEFTLAAKASLPPPFTAIGGDNDWALTGDAALPLDRDEAAGCCAPFPLLVSIATDRADATLLLDLEQLGLVPVIGGRERALGLLRHIVAELANSPWAEDIEILLVGFGDDLVPLNPERLRTVPDLATGLAAIGTRLRSMQDNVERLPVDSVLDGRLRNIASDSWLPTLLIAAVDPTDDEQDTLDELAMVLGSRDRLGVAVLTTTTPTNSASSNPHAASILLRDDGALTTSGIDDETWFAEAISADTAARLAAVLGATSEPDPPAGPARGPDPWADGMNDDGTLAPDPPPPGSAPAPEALAAEPDIAMPQPRPSDPEALRKLAHVEGQDPHLDGDLERWRAEGTPEVPLVAILGEPVVRAPGEEPRVRRGWFIEILVYLSLHPRGVTSDKALTDLWPEGNKIKITTVRSAFYGARRWAGSGLDGDRARTFISDMQTDSTYRLRGHILDWDLFRRLRQRAQARNAARHPGAVADYEAALGLVRGQVFNAARHRGYAWMYNHDQRHDLHIPGFIVDTAHELVDIALADGDTALARRAAETARAVDVDVVFDRPLTDLMRIAHAEDSQSELERYAAILLDARTDDACTDLTDETSAVLNDLLPSGPRRRPS